MNDRTYFFLVKLLDINVWGGDLLDEENLPKNGPAVFVSNHMGSLGPIGVVCSTPIRLYSWIIAETVDPLLAPDHVRIDFVEKDLHLEPPMSYWVSKAICKISVPLLHSIGCVPVYHDFEGFQKTFEISLDILQQGKSLLIFPEDPDRLADPVTGICPFKKGFARLGELYFQASGSRLKFYPLAVHERRRVMVGMPVVFSPVNRLTHERLRIKNQLEKSIRNMYLEMAHEDSSWGLDFARQG